MILLDADVLIEILRGREEALEWLAARMEEEIAIPGLAAMEVVAGARNQRELQEVQAFLGDFEIVWPSETMMRLALDLLVRLRLRYGVGVPDCMIAATALVMGARLATFNVKHFRNVEGLEVMQPYVRGGGAKG